MRNRFKRALIATLGVVAVLSLAVIPAGGQARAYRAPRAADGKPNFNGIWQALNEAYWDVEAHAAGPGLVLDLGASNAVPGGEGIVECGDGELRSIRLGSGGSRNVYFDRGSTII